jgi:chaperonin cofactor prefoldin
MILWDRIFRNMNDGVEAIMRVAFNLSERTRLESSVARLMVQKGRLESKLDKLNRELGEKVSHMWEQKSDDIIADLEVQDILGDISDVRERIEALRAEIKAASIGETVEPA